MWLRNILHGVTHVPEGIVGWQWVSGHVCFALQQMGNIKCSQTTCPEVTCLNPIHTDRQCCPTCPGNTLRLNTLTCKDRFQSQSCEVVLTRICYTLWWFAHKGRVVSQAPQHFRFFFKWKILVMVALACQFVCSVISLDSGMSRALHLQKPLKAKVKGPKALCEATSPYFKN